MALTKIKIKDFVIQRNEKNRTGLVLPFIGLNRDKEFMPTVATTDGLDCKKYKILRQGYFVYSGMQTGRDNCIRLGYYTEANPSLISPAYITFTVDEKKVIPEYFFMLFKSDEKDRYGSFLSDGSIRSNLDWDFFCNITLEIPSLDTQKKYVNIYNSLIKNQKLYENKLDDLKIVCEGYIENLRRTTPNVEIGWYIRPTRELNTKLNVQNIVGLYDEDFKNSRREMNKDDYSKYQIIRKGCICYPPPHFGNVGTIGLYENDEPALISPMYVLFRSKDLSKLIPEYLMMWFRREEFKRYGGFHSDGSIRDTFDYGEIARFKIPIPSIEVQKSIANIYLAYRKCKKISEDIKKQLKEICPILIKGSIVDEMG